MTILQTKGAQPGDSDDPPPKKKPKKLKSLVRNQSQTHVTPASSLPGPSRRSDHQNIYSYLSSSPYFGTEPEPTYLNSAPQPYFDNQSDRVIFKFKLEKFDVGTPPKPPSQSDPYNYHSDFSAAGPSHTQQVPKTQIYNPDCLEYYIYGPGSRSPNSRASATATSTTAVSRSTLKRPLPQFDLIEVLSSEDIPPHSSSVHSVSENQTSVEATATTSCGDGSLLDDINNFDIDDKFGELEKFQQAAIWEDSKMYHLESRTVDIMLNGIGGGVAANKSSSTGSHHQEQHTPLYGPLTTTRGSFRTNSYAPATLSNLGNTCFLNSVLYTLRFAPNFLHNLHHLVADMGAVDSAGKVYGATQSTLAKKTSSLGRNLSLMSWPRERDKDVVATGAGDLTVPSKTKKQIVTERLHEVYEAMRAAENKETCDSFHPDVFLTALREVNPIFEGNQQQDAHEFLVCLLDIFRETCQASARQAETRAAIQANNYNLRLQSRERENVAENGSKKSSSKPWMPIRNKSIKPEAEVFSDRWRNENNTLFSSINKLKSKRNAEGSECDFTQTIDDNEQIGPSDVNNLILEPPRLVDNFVRDFEGVMVLRTTCLECCNTTEKRELFADICVPIKTDNDDDDDGDRSESLNPSELYERAVATDEFLRDSNKYYCEECLRYNEARRSVSYQTLPRLLTLQLKRFSSTYGAMSKVTKFMPTPMSLACFCEDCKTAAATHQDANNQNSSSGGGGMRGVGRSATPRLSPGHSYELYGVIMHLGPNMAGGHYIAYVRMSNSVEHYMACTRTTPFITSETAKSSINNKFINLFKAKANASGLNEKLNMDKFNTATRKMCRGAECCGVRCITDPDLTAGCKYEPEPAWLACDDDNVKALSASEVEDLLAKSSTSNATPYLLFYARKTDAVL